MRLGSCRGWHVKHGDARTQGLWHVIKDVDNVIYLSKVDGKFTIQSGALEYENTQYSVLKIVADNIEGGLQTIQGRMKRYEKNI